MLALDDFIAEAMTSIVHGILKGQADPEVGDYIAPLIQGERRNDFGNFHLKDDRTSQATILQFDVQVGTELSKEGGPRVGAKARLVVVDVELGGSGQLKRQSTSLHRLQFAVPLRIPTHTANGTAENIEG